ncbi:MAG: amidohydrolase family protein, partial [Candidatus Dormibacteraceae bacterium]
MSYKVFGIRAARLFDGHTVHEGPVLILIDSGQIQDVDLTGALPPEGAELIDLGDTTLLPGLVDSHTHLVWDPSGNPENLATDSNADLLLRARKHATAALHSGITTVRDLGDRDFATLQLRNEDQAGQGIGPELLVAGPPIT